MFYRLAPIIKENGTLNRSHTQFLRRYIKNKKKPSGVYDGKEYLTGHDLGFSLPGADSETLDYVDRGLLELRDAWD